MEDKPKRRWQLTENNATFTKQECCEGLAKVATTIYCIAGHEKGERGTEHIHAFVIYKNAISLSSLKKAFPRAHFEACRGSNIENRDYVVKDDKEPFESGEMPLGNECKAKRNVASEILTLLYNGKNLYEVMASDEDFADYIVRNFKNLQLIEKEVQSRHFVKWKQEQRK